MEFIHDAEYARLRAPPQVLPAYAASIFGHLPTDGSPSYRQRMSTNGQATEEQPEDRPVAEEAGIVAVNLDKLIQHAKDHHKLGKPASKKAIATWIEQHGAQYGYSAVRSTVQRTLNGKTKPRVDTLGAVARAYGLEAWQLLIKEFDPEHPPVLLGITAVNAIIASLNNVAQKHQQQSGDAEAERPSPRPNSHRARTEAGAVHPAIPRSHPRKTTRSKARKG